MDFGHIQNSETKVKVRRDLLFLHLAEQKNTIKSRDEIKA